MTSQIHLCHPFRWVYLERFTLVFVLQSSRSGNESFLTYSIVYDGHIILKNWGLFARSRFLLFWVKDFITLSRI